jgi:hypothetical protein
MSTKIHDIVCRGHRAGTGAACQTVLYQSDGMFLYVAGLILNADLIKQTVKCASCGYTMIWRRREDFITGGGGSCQKLNNRLKRRRFS